MREKMSTSLDSVKKAVLISIIMLLLCGLGYPLLLTGVANTFFPSQAKGSLVEVDGKAVGSPLVGQDFTEAYFMKCRPSSVNYNTYTKEQAESGAYGGVASGSNNFAPSNPALVARVEADMEAFLKANPQLSKEDIPTDLLTASGSGLDPHISPEAAQIQLAAIGEASGLSKEALGKIVSKNTEKKLFGIFGEETVNVLGVNIEIAQEMGLIGSGK